MRTLLVLLAAAGLTTAEPLRIAWKAGEARSYRVKQTTTVTEELPKQPATVIANLVDVTKTWTVNDVAADGTATLTLTLTAMKQEIRRSGEEPLVLDSATAEGAKALESLLGKAILTAKVDNRGRVLDVQATIPDGGKRLKAELPFRIELPDTTIDGGTTWTRAVAIVLDPPAGTGETVQAEQQCSGAKIADGIMTIQTRTTLKDPPKEAADWQPLVPWLWEGEVLLDTKTGHYLGATLKIAKTLKDHQGAGSKWTFESTFEEAMKK
jgi:hypothetical protein